MEPPCNLWGMSKFTPTWGKKNILATTPHPKTGEDRIKNPGKPVFVRTTEGTVLNEGNYREFLTWERTGEENPTENHFQPNYEIRPNQLSVGTPGGTGGLFRDSKP